MCQWTASLLPQVMASHLLDTKPLSKKIMNGHQLNSNEQFSVKCESKYQICTWKGPLQNVNHLLRPQCVHPLLDYICVSKLTIIGSEKGLSPGRRQAIFLTNAGILLIAPLGSNFSEILIEIPTFSFKKMHVKMSSAKTAAICLGLNVLNL